MKYLFFCLPFLLPPFLFAQKAERACRLVVEPVLNGQMLAIDGAGLPPDSLVLHQLRFYLGHFTFYKNHTMVREEHAYHLLDLEDPATLHLDFQLPGNILFDSLAFNLGIDSLTTASGAMGGDLDPTKGMFWTWQSGYVHFKMEGFSKKCPARNGEFQFHLGGYLPPYATARRVGLKLKTAGNGTQHLTLELAPFFEQADWPNRHNVMSPGAEAVRLSRILATSFGIHAQ